MTTIRRLLLGGLAALIGGSALAQQPMPKDTKAAGTQPVAKPVDVTIDPVSGAIVITQGAKYQWKPVLPQGLQLLKVEPSDPAGLLVEQSLTDPNTQTLTGLKIGIYKLYLTVGKDGNDTRATTREFEVVVQPNFEQLRRTITKAVPTASIEIIPGPGNTIILAGYVNKPEDAEMVMNIARATTISSSTTTQTTGTSTGPTAPASTMPGATQPNGGIGTTQNAAVSTQSTSVGTIINAIQVGGLQHVQIEVVFCSVNRTKLRQRGTDFTINGGNANFSSLIGGILPNNGNINFGIAPAGLRVALNAFKTENLAKFLSEPKIVTQSGRPAVLRSGGRQAVIGPNNGALGGTSVILEPVGTTMAVLPIVYGNGKIYLEVSPSIITPNAAFGINLSNGITSTGFSEQSVTASVMLESGQTFAIGGLLETQNQSTVTKTAVLGEIPYIAPLFSRSVINEIETELIILVTPRLVDAMDCNQTPKRAPGGETRSPDDYEFFLEGLLEAPRGQRQVWNGKCYNAAWKCDPLKVYPVKGNICTGSGNCGGSVPTCLPGAGAVLAPVTPIAPQAMPTAPAAAPVPAPTTLPTAAPKAEPVVMPAALPTTPEPSVIVPIIPESTVTPGPVAPTEVPAPAPIAPGGN